MDNGETEDNYGDVNEETIANVSTSANTPALFTSGKLRRLTEAIGSVVDDYMMVSFVMMDPNDEDSLDEVLAHTDHAIQYGEDLEPKDSNYNDDQDVDEDPYDNEGDA